MSIKRASGNFSRIKNVYTPKLGISMMVGADGQIMWIRHFHLHSIYYIIKDTDRTVSKFEKVSTE